MQGTHSSFKTVLGVFGVLAATGCGADEQQLRARAAFDLSCPENQIRVQEIDGRTVGVRGCGQKAVYIESCNAPVGHMGRDCTWVLNSDSRRTGKDE